MNRKHTQLSHQNNRSKAQIRENRNTLRSALLV